MLPERVDSEVRVAGWVHRRRDHGGLIFIDLRDRTGLVQLVFHPDQAGDAFELAHGLRAEDVLSVSGKVEKRSPETVNPKLPTGEVEVTVAEARLLSDADTPPFEIESFSGEVSEETRLKHRYLDLRRDRMREAIELRHRVARAMREFLSGEGFLEIETPVLTRSTPEGARDFLVPSRLQPGSFYALPQSPQLFKQMLMVGGMERYFQIARCFRDEDQRADRQPDFTQLDIEMSFVDAEDVIDLNERLLASVLAVGGVEVELPMRRLPYDEAIARYGTDRPDLRFGLELVEVTDVFRDSEFKAFKGAIDDGALVRALNVGSHDFSRGVWIRFVSDAQELGAAGPRLGRGRGRRLALAGGEVPLRAGDLGGQRGAGSKGGRRAAAGGRLARDLGVRARGAATPPGRAPRPDRPRCERAHLDRRLAPVRLEPRRGPLGPPPPPVYVAPGGV